MKITRKEEKFTEAMLNDMYAEKLLEKYYDSDCAGGGVELFISLCVWVQKDTGLDFLSDISLFDTYEECKEDYNFNRAVFTTHDNCYQIFITGKRIAYLKDKPLYVVIESEAIEH